MGLSQDRNTPRRAGDQFEFPVAAATTCYAGGIAVLSGGVVQPGTTATNLVAVGVFDERANNSLGSASAINAKVRTGVFRFANSASGDAIALSDVGKECFIVDDQTVAKTAAGGRSVAGIVRDVDSVGVWVEFTPLAGRIVEVDVTLTSAQLLALYTTPIDAIAAPAAGIAVVPLSSTQMLDYGGTAYDGIATGEDLVLRYTDASGAIAATIEATGFLDASADAHRHAVFASLATLTPAAKLVWHMTTGNIATGNSVLKTRTRFMYVPVLS